MRDLRRCDELVEGEALGHLTDAQRCGSNAVGAVLEALAARPLKTEGEVAAESPAAVVARACRA